MGISEAIARVRKSAKQARRALLAGANGRFEDSALASVGASLGAGLQSDVIPARLRPAASRIASLLGAASEPQRELPSLDGALSAQPGALMPASHAGQAGTSAEVCPFTGLHADGSFAASTAAAGTAAAGTAAASIAAVSTDTQAQGASVRVEPPISESDAAHEAVAARGPSDDAKLAALDEPVVASAMTEAVAPSLAKPSAPAKERAAKRADGAGKASATRAPSKERGADKNPPAEKAKEKLAGEASVAKTSARSATKPAAKQTNGKANQRKK